MSIKTPEVVAGTQKRIKAPALIDLTEADAQVEILNREINYYQSGICLDSSIYQGANSGIWGKYIELKSRYDSTSNVEERKHLHRCISNLQGTAVQGFRNIVNRVKFMNTIYMRQCIDHGYTSDFVQMERTLSALHSSGHTPNTGDHEPQATPTLEDMLNDGKHPATKRYYKKFAKKLEVIQRMRQHYCNEWRAQDEQRICLNEFQSRDLDSLQDEEFVENYKPVNSNTAQQGIVGDEDTPAEVATVEPGVTTNKQRLKVVSTVERDRKEVHKGIDRIFGSQLKKSISDSRST